MIVNGTFTLEGGSIIGNTASADDGSNYSGNGGGVYVQGTMTMSGGSIRDNYAKDDFYFYNNDDEDYYRHGMGGGICIASKGIMTMSGGGIRNNESDSAGGGVCVDDLSSFTMNAGASTQVDNRRSMLDTIYCGYFVLMTQYTVFLSDDSNYRQSKLPNREEPSAGLVWHQHIVT